MKIVILFGSPRKNDSFKVCSLIEEKMKKKADVSFEYIFLSQLNIAECRGCELCFTKGEHLCPLKDDISLVREKLKEADGIIIASPVYACHITGTLKKTVDRLSFFFHRPELVGKPALTVTTTAGGGIKPTLSYLKMIAVGWGCYHVGTIKVVVSMFFENRWLSGFFRPKYVVKTNQKMDKTVDVFYKALISQKMPVPSFYDIYVFNGLKSKTYTSDADYIFWKEKGWLNADYYYQAPIGAVKKLFGKALNGLIKIMISKMQMS